MAEETARAQVLPLYIVVDVSYSMSVSDDGDGGATKIDAANQVIKDLRNALAEAPVIADKVRVSAIDFSDDAQIALPLCDLSIQTSIPDFTVRGGTSYAAAFRTLRDQIQADVDQLKADRLAVHRPATFFISDGEPTDDERAWRDAFRELTDYDKATKQGFAFFPNFVPMGIGAQPETLTELVHPKDRSKAYFMKDGASAAKALSQMTQLLVASTLMSGMSVGKGGGGFVLPDDDELGDLISAADGDGDML